MSFMLFCVEFKLQESRPLATRTHAKREVNSTVRVTTLMCCHWKLLQINFYNHNLMMQSCFSVLYFHRQTKTSIVCG